MGKRNFLKEVVFWIKLIIFLIALFAGCVGIKSLYTAYKDSSKLVENTATVQKVVTKDNKSFVYLKYKVEAVYYDNMKVENTRGLEQGDEVTIYYDPFNPFDTDKISFDGVKIENIFLIFIVVVFILFMGWMVISHIGKVRAHNNENIRGNISTATLSNDFDDFMKEIEDK